MQEDMAKLFGLFSKIRDKRVENPLGVGLGLAICKQLVRVRVRVRVKALP